MLGSRTWIALLLVLVAAGCTKKKKKDPIEEVPDGLNAEAEQASIARSYVYEVAQDPSLLFSLAKSAPNAWTSFFQGKHSEAYRAFSGVKSPSAVVRVGMARAALEKARAFDRLSALQNAVLPDYLKALKTLPGEKQMDPWFAFMEWRLRWAQGDRAVPEWAQSSDRDFEKLRVSIRDPNSGLGQLLLERPLDSAASMVEVDALGSEYIRMLRLRSNIESWPTKRLIKHWGNLSTVMPMLLRRSDRSVSCSGILWWSTRANESSPVQRSRRWMGLKSVGHS